MTGQGKLAGSLVFVYGTLRRGESNHFLIQSARYCGEHRTSPEYHFWDCGAYPAASRGGSTAIDGELYGVSPRLLRALDRLEDVPRLYRREIISTDLGSAWIYLVRGRPPGAPKLALGDWCARRGCTHMEQEA